MTYPVPDEDGTEEPPRARSPGRWPAPPLRAAVELVPPPDPPPPRRAARRRGLRPRRGWAREHQDVPVDPDLVADEPALLATASAAKAAGSVTLLHCEDGAMLRQAGEKLIAEGRGAIANFPDARPVAAEVAAVDQAIGIARRTGARVYVVHLSSAAALDRCRRARAAGRAGLRRDPAAVPAPHQGTLCRAGRGKYAGAPPLREASDREALWAGLAGATSTRCAATTRRGRWTPSSIPSSTR